MADGFDANFSLIDNAACFWNAGKRFVGRYYGPTESKLLTGPEAQHLCDTGFYIVTVFEFRNDAGYFSHSQGVTDANLALQQAASAGQPSGSPIYFGADNDFDEETV